ncbi:DUF721 domain-containing protein [Streptomyces filamentosus]|uniref:DUF721 domain-containing protein n=1 Tax=Streptomyces filamentosus TaxID=67294 RepID=UPI0033FD1D84
MNSDPPTSSGADLARVALRRAKEAARKAGGQTTKPKRVVRRDRANGRDPVALGSAMKQWLVDSGYEKAANGGSLLDRWPKIIGTERAAHWQAVRFEEDSRTLTVMYESDSWGRMLALATRQIIASVNETLGSGTLADIKIRKGTVQPAAASSPPEVSPTRATRPLPPGSPPPTAYLEIRARMREQYAYEPFDDAPPPSRLISDRIQESPDGHAEARYLMDDLEAQAARSADSHARALLRARQDRAARRAGTSPTAPRESGAA